ncbi:hypothetical protein MH117_17865 [Paenibacillus sp. ACRRX]|uniref:hypothetical protein n=1 Tax=Paenibacillus sp. ACRRX TaxID=2918206 RepID=UPI001EF6F989|nr:hypothetical protein [Paenibacillus sp. ACRRX]MCG7409288.1 hypothetical protein [Paenibacillus sp. ACRRX]
MADLFTQVSVQLGLTEEDIHRGTLTTGASTGPMYLSTKPQFPTAVTPKIVSIQTVQELQTLVGNIKEAGVLQDVPEPWPDEKWDADAKQLNESDNRKVYAALRAILAGKDTEMTSYTSIVNKRYFPIKAGVFACEDIVVTPDQPLIIEPHGHDPVVLTCNSITLEPGGQIICQAPVILSVNTFTKK